VVISFSAHFSIEKVLTVSFSFSLHYYTGISSPPFGFDGEIIVLAPSCHLDLESFVGNFFQREDIKDLALWSLRRPEMPRRHWTT